MSLVDIFNIKSDNISLSTTSADSLALDNPNVKTITVISSNNLFVFDNSKIGSNTSPKQIDTAGETVTADFYNNSFWLDFEIYVSGFSIHAGKVLQLTSIATHSADAFDAVITQLIADGNMEVTYDFGTLTTGNNVQFRSLFEGPSTGLKTRYNSPYAANLIADITYYEDNRLASVSQAKTIADTATEVFSFTSAVSSLYWDGDIEAIEWYITTDGEEKGLDDFDNIVITYPTGLKHPSVTNNTGASIGLTAVWVY